MAKYRTAVTVWTDVEFEDDGVNGLTSQAHDAIIFMLPSNIDVIDYEIGEPRKVK